MDFTFSAEQDMLRETVRGFLESKLPPARVREMMESDSGFDGALWTEMAQMGWPAMHIPEQYGGAGFSFVELGIVLEETGRILAPSPLFASVALGANLLLLAGTEDQKSEHLAAVAAGETRLAVAIAEPGGGDSGGWGAADIATTARVEDGHVVITGTKSFVIDGHTADVLIVAAREEGADDDLGFYVIPAGTPGVGTEKLVTMDMTRQQATVTFDDVRLPATVRLSGATVPGTETLSTLYDLAVTCMALEQVGSATRCMEMSVAYAKERMQFGRPIGSFQAVKHMCANMLVSVESARSAAYHAAWAAAHDPTELRIAAPVAKAYCSEAFFQVAGDTIQVHGGIGFTWEHDAHLYFKRAKSGQLMFGTPSQWRSELADRLNM